MSTKTQMITCPVCAAELAPGSDPCPSCGASRTGDETLELTPKPVLPDPRLAGSSADLPPTIHLAHRQPMGIHPVPLLGGLGSLTGLLAIVLLGLGDILAGLLVLALTGVLVTMCRLAIRREPEAPGAVTLIRGLDRLRSGGGLLAVGIRTHALSALALMRIRARQRRLRGELRSRMSPLGEAVYREDHARAQALTEEASEFEQALQLTEEEAAAVLRGARREIGRERAASQPTEVLPSLGSESAGPRQRPLPDQGGDWEPKRGGRRS